MAYMDDDYGYENAMPNNVSVCTLRYIWEGAGMCAEECPRRVLLCHVCAAIVHVWIYILLRGHFCIDFRL